ncbi:transposase [Pinirhizobacter sp.]|jgi:transposase-like protein|uniref:transposase n=1 Tax=Pinirhizobacter sp. TaxID=2950432 RepID=UPI002F40E108
MTKKNYPETLKELAVARVVHGRERVALVCRDLDIKAGSLYLWLRKHDITNVPRSTIHLPEPTNG